MEKRKLITIFLLIIVSLFFFLHSVNVLHVIDFNWLSKYFNFDSYMEGGALTAAIILYVIIFLFILYVIIEVISLITKRRFEEASSGVKKARDIVGNRVERMGIGVARLIFAIFITAAIMMLLLSIGIFHCVTEVSYGGSIQSTSCPPIEQSTFLFIGVFCLCYLIPDKILRAVAKRIV